jgi:hypothetical protein
MKEKRIGELYDMPLGWICGVFVFFVCTMGGWNGESLKMKNYGSSSNNIPQVSYMKTSSVAPVHGNNPRISRSLSIPILPSVKRLFERPKKGYNPRLIQRSINKRNTSFKL